MGKCYKVVRGRTDRIGGLWSAVIFEKYLRTKYVVGEWVKALEFAAARGYHLLAFDNRHAAEDFARDRTDAQVWECEVQGVIRDLPPSGVSNLFGGRQDFLWPPNTIMAEKIKLTKRVG